VAVGEFFDARLDCCGAEGFGVEHGAAAPGGEAVAGDVDHVDVGGAQGHAFFEDAGAFVYERQDAAVDDFFLSDDAAFYAGGAGCRFDEGGYFGIGRGLAVFVVARPASSGFLA